MEKAEFFIREWTRSNLALPEGVELGLLEVGHYACPEGDLYPEETGTYAAIVWGVSGELTLKTGLRDLVVRSGTAAVLMPGAHFSTSCRGAVTEFYYMAVDGPGAEKAVSEAKLWEGVFACQSIPIKWLEHLSGDIDNLPRQTTLASLAWNLFSLLRSEAERATEDKLVWEAESILQLQWRDPDLNIKDLLARLGVSRSTLAPRFKKATGLSPQEYLGDIRYRHALKRLHGTSLSCAQIAYECGFSDPNYFSRWFTLRHGAAPSSLGKRKQ